jgi:hypothetical protein
MAAPDIDDIIVELAAQCDDDSFDDNGFFVLGHIVIALRTVSNDPSVAHEECLCSAICKWLLDPERFRDANETEVFQKLCIAARGVLAKTVHTQAGSSIGPQHLLASAIYIGTSNTRGSNRECAQSNSDEEEEDNDEVERRDIHIALLAASVAVNCEGGRPVTPDICTQFVRLCDVAVHNSSCCSSDTLKILVDALPGRPDEYLSLGTDRSLAVQTTIIESLGRRASSSDQAARKKIAETCTGLIVHAASSAICATCGPQLAKLFTVLSSLVSASVDTECTSAAALTALAVYRAYWIYSIPHAAVVLAGVRNFFAKTANKSTKPLAAAAVYCFADSIKTPSISPGRMSHTEDMLRIAHEHCRHVPEAVKCLANSLPPGPFPPAEVESLARWNDWIRACASLRSVPETGVAAAATSQSAPTDIACYAVSCIRPESLLSTDTLQMLKSAFEIVQLDGAETCVQKVVMALPRNISSASLSNLALVLADDGVYPSSGKTTVVRDELSARASADFCHELGLAEAFGYLLPSEHITIARSYLCGFWGEDAVSSRYSDLVSGTDTVKSLRILRTCFASVRRTDSCDNGAAAVRIIKNVAAMLFSRKTQSDSDCKKLAALIGLHVIVCGTPRPTSSPPPLHFENFGGRDNCDACSAAEIHELAEAGRMALEYAENTQLFAEALALVGCGDVWLVSRSGRKFDTRTVADLVSSTDHARFSCCCHTVAEALMIVKCVASPLDIAGSERGCEILATCIDSAVEVLCYDQNVADAATLMAAILLRNFFTTVQSDSAALSYLRGSCCIAVYHAIRETALPTESIKNWCEKGISTSNVAGATMRAQTEQGLLELAPVYAKALRTFFRAIFIRAISKGYRNMPTFFGRGGIDAYAEQSIALLDMCCETLTTIGSMLTGHADASLATKMANSQEIVDQVNALHDSLCRNNSAIAFYLRTPTPTLTTDYVLPRWITLENTIVGLVLEFANLLTRATSVSSPEVLVRAGNIVKVLRTSPGTTISHPRDVPPV